MPKRRKLIAANWKMNGRINSGVQLATELVGKLRSAPGATFDLAICPPATLLWPIAEVIAGTHLQLGGQDCHTATHGPFTGDVSAAMLGDIGCKYVIVGHSERRYGHGETDHLVSQKVGAAQMADLTPILCIGEPKDVRDAGKAEDFVVRQLRASLPEQYKAAQMVIAYEPVWAIGTGVTPSPEDIQKMHQFIREALGTAGEGMQILYGGSVTPQTSVHIMRLEDVDGGLVGAASLNADSFWQIAQNCK